MSKKAWREEFDAQVAVRSTYDNGFDCKKKTGISNIDEIPFSIGKIVWVIMADNYSLGGYEEWCIEYGITIDGTWAAVEDSHCSCNGWEADESNITYYDNFDLLIKADNKARVLLAYKKELIETYPFIKKYLKQEVK